jgi:hypothetical protein
VGSQIKDLVAMRDVESLYEIMSENENWMTQLDAAEGLVKLGDRRGLEFLVSAEQSEEREIREVAREILESPSTAKMRGEVEDEERRALEAKIEVARKRLQKGQKVFQYKMVYLPSGDILNEDPMSEGFEVPALDEFGLEGWEVVNILPRRNQVLAGNLAEHLTGAYFLLKREVAPEESAGLGKSQASIRRF